MNDFVYNIPVKVYFGTNQLMNLNKEIRKYGKKVLIVYGGSAIKSNGLYVKIKNELYKDEIDIYELENVQPNPRIELVRKGAEICKTNKIDVVLAIGGGSVIDTAKWIAAASCVQHDAWDFFCKRTEIKDALPIITVLTLAATGSEMNAGGVISNPETLDKRGRASELLFPKVSFLNPENTYTVNRFQTACGAADMLSHIIEVYFNKDENLYMLDCFMEGLMKTILKYAPIAMENPYDYEARANLMWTASWAINGFINGGCKQDWSCHPMEHELSAKYDITHGLGLAILMPAWLQYCMDKTNVSRYYSFGVNVFGIDRELSEREVAKKSIECLQNFLYNTLGLKNKLSDLKIAKEDFNMMASKICENGPLIGFKKLNVDDITNIYNMCY